MKEIQEKEQGKKVWRKPEVNILILLKIHEWWQSCNYSHETFIHGY